MEVGTVPEVDLNSAGSTLSSVVQTASGSPRIPSQASCGPGSSLAVASVRGRGWVSSGAGRSPRSCAVRSSACAGLLEEGVSRKMLYVGSSRGARGGGTTSGNSGAIVCLSGRASGASLGRGDGSAGMALPCNLSRCTDSTGLGVGDASALDDSPGHNTRHAAGHVAGDISTLTLITEQVTRTKWHTCRRLAPTGRLGIHRPLCTWIGSRDALQALHER